MAKTFHTFLFGDNRIATASSGQSKYGHTFGGPHDRKGMSCEDCNGVLIHLLHRLDLADPAIPIAIPGIRWLPLYYCIDFRADDLGYRLISDEELVTFFPADDSDVSKEEAWPDDEDYPLEFPKSAIIVEARDYDPTKLDDAYRWAGIFGLGKLSERKMAAAKTRVAKLMDSFGFDIPETEKEFEDALCSPFIHEKPHAACLNPECSNRTKRGQLTTIALMPAQPVKGVHTFPRWGGYSAQVIFQLCPKCYTIRVSNQYD